MSHSIPDDTYDQRTLNQEGIFQDENREERIDRKINKLQDLTKMINQSADKKAILNYIRQRQIAEMDPAVIAKAIDSNHPLAIEEQKARMLAEITQYDLVNAQFSLLYNIQQDIRYMRELTETRRRKGLPFASRFTVAPGMLPIKLDFGGVDKIIPSGSLTAGAINMPRRPVSKITFFNRGTGILLFGIVEELNDETTDVVVLATDPPFTVELDDPLITLVNIRATTANTIVDMIAQV